SRIAYGEYALSLVTIEKPHSEKPTSQDLAENQERVHFTFEEVSNSSLILRSGRPMAHPAVPQLAASRGRRTCSNRLGVRPHVPPGPATGQRTRRTRLRLPPA